VLIFIKRVRKPEARPTPIKPGLGLRSGFLIVPDKQTYQASTGGQWFPPSFYLKLSKETLHNCMSSSKQTFAIERLKGVRIDYGLGHYLVCEIEILR